MMPRRRLNRLGRRCRLLLLTLLVVTPLSAVAQGKREIDLIAELGKEVVAQREAAAAAAAEAEHQARLEEQSRLRAVYQQYLGESRRAAQQAIAKKWRAANQEEVEALRRQAMIVIELVNDETKKRVHDELDPLYEKLEALIAVTPDELLKANPTLNELHKKLGVGNDLAWVDQAAILYALCPDDEQAKVIAANVPLRENLSEDEAQAIDLCNRRRLVLGLSALAIDDKLVAAARDHSADMVSLGFFSHDSPVEGKAKFWQRAKNFGTTAQGENIAAGYNNGTAVTMGWWYSPGHLKNMMNSSHRRIGVGQKDQHYTQLFGR